MPFNKRYYVIALLLSICVLIETLSLTYVQQQGATFYYLSSLLYLFTGLAICILPIISIRSGKSIVSIDLLSKAIPYISGISVAALIIYHIVRLIPLYSDVSIDSRWADMIPCMQVACRRFLHGEIVYSPAPEVWVGCIIPYLPMMWAPFLPASIFDFDFRWITFAMQASGIIVMMIPFFRRRRSIPLLPAIIAGIGLFLLLNYLLIKHDDYWSMTEEGVVAGFYILLCYAVLRQNYWLIGLSIMTCTLSRYSLLLWVPVYFIFVFLTRPASDFRKLLVSYAVSMLGLFIIPFFIPDPYYFIHIPDSYMGPTEHFWHTKGIEQHLYYNVGLFKFFAFAQIHTMFILELVTSFAAPALLIAVVLWAKKRGYRLNDRYIAYASLKISLVFFYGFIQMPYLYIFVPATLISYVVLFDYLSGGQMTEGGP